jgi:hypothetical protein
MSEQIIQQNKCVMAYSNGVNMFTECVAAVVYRTLVLVFHFVQNEPIVKEGELLSFFHFGRHSYQEKKLKSRIRLLITSILYATQNLFCSGKAFLTEQMKFGEFHAKHTLVRNFITCCQQQQNPPAVVQVHGPNMFRTG